MHIDTYPLKHTYILTHAQPRTLTYTQSCRGDTTLVSISVDVSQCLCPYQLSVIVVMEMGRLPVYQASLKRSPQLIELTQVINIYRHLQSGLHSYYIGAQSGLTQLIQRITVRSHS